MGIHLTGRSSRPPAGAAATENVLDTIAAAAKLLLPAWLATIVQLPGETSVSVLPTTVHTGVVVDANDTVRPEVAVATSEGGAVPIVWLPGDANVMVCAVSGAAATLKVFDTGAADA